MFSLNDEIKTVFEVFLNKILHKITSSLLMTMLQVIQHEIMLLNTINYPKVIKKSNFGCVLFLKRSVFSDKINGGGLINFI